MTDITSPSPPLSQQPQQPAAAPALGIGASLAKAGYQLGGMLAPTLAGRIAADAFGRSRSKGGRTLFRMPLGAQTFEIAGNEDVRHGYLWKNHGPTVLLVHGWGSDSSSMIGFVKPLLALGFQVASFDAPAHGESAGNKTTMTRFVKAVGAAIKSLDNVQVIVGHSLGSIASVAAIAHADARHAEAVKRLVLIAAPVSLSTVLERWSTNQHQQLPPAVIGKIYDRLQVQNGVPVSHWDISVLGAAMEVPVLVVHDEHDPVVPLSEAQKLMRSLKNVRLEQTSGLGHSRILSATPVKELITRFIGPSHLTPTSLEPSND
jgi:omega-6 fatty acid desaturase (delta-12 desaturase)